MWKLSLLSNFPILSSVFVSASYNKYLTPRVFGLNNFIPFGETQVVRSEVLIRMISGIFSKAKGCVTVGEYNDKKNSDKKFWQFSKHVEIKIKYWKAFAYLWLASRFSAMPRLRNCWTMPILEVLTDWAIALSIFISRQYLSMFLPLLLPPLPPLPKLSQLEQKRVSCVTLLTKLASILVIWTCVPDLLGFLWLQRHSGSLL